MRLDLHWLAEFVGNIDAVFRRRPKSDLPVLLRSLANGLPREIPSQGFHDAAALAESGAIVDAWDEYNRALADLASAIRVAQSPMP